MKKAMLATSALAGLAFLTMGSTPTYGETLTSGAVAPSLKINGFTAINTYFVNQKSRNNGRGGPQPHIAVDASNLYFAVQGVSSNGLEYMYRVIFETIPGSGTVIDQNYIQIKSSRLGTFQIGGTVGVEDTMIWDAGKIIGGTGGFDGGYNNVYNMSAGVVRGNDNVADTGTANKIVYYSPEIAGVTFGISYTPSTARKGDDKLDNKKGGTEKTPGNRGLYEHKDLQPFDLRSVAIGLTYKKEVGKWSITLSGAGISAKSYFYNSSIGRVPFQNAKAYQLGAVLGYGDFRFGGGFLDNGKSRLPHASNFTYTQGKDTINLDSVNTGNSGKAWNIGANYTIGAYQLAASYQRTTRNTGNSQKVGSDFYSATVDVTPLQGLKVYTEVDYIRSRTNSTAIAREKQLVKAPNSVTGNNSGVIGIAGMKVSF